MNIHMYQDNLMKYGNGVYHMTLRIYNRHHKKLKVLSNDTNKFKGIFLFKFFLYIGYSFNR
jgi:hypothetical protein